MNRLGNVLSHTQEAAALEARFGLRVGALLTECSVDLPPDVAERLRFGRERAVARARELQQAVSTTASSGGALVLGGGWWSRLAAALPVAALALALVVYQKHQNDEQVSLTADIDAALLSDDVPPAAYADAGFAQFLKAPAPTDQ